MKKLLAVAALAGFLFATQSVDPVVADVDNPDHVQLCKTLQTFPFFNMFWKNLGDCVSDFTVRNDGPAKFCQSWGDTFGWPSPPVLFIPSFENQGQCVSWARHL